MDTMAASMMARSAQKAGAFIPTFMLRIERGASHESAKPMVFDWIKAAQIIKRCQPEEAIAGLASDEGYTAGVIYRDGSPVEDEYTYLASLWAAPFLDCDGTRVDCYTIDNPDGWDSGTKWPDGAKAILS